ncbi:MAG: hypothetical protein KatS3mg103_0283 [Phycisphaerales bacterium]|nr:MAG: hypothetical protein KatS3mg103_0283 [Phycisphaerales bacterium]
MLQDLLGNQDTRDTQDTQDAQAPTNTQAMDLLAELTGAQGGTNAPALLADLLHDARGILRRSPPDAWTCLEDEVKRAPTPKQAQRAAGKLAKLDPPLERQRQAG